MAGFRRFRQQPGAGLAGGDGARPRAWPTSWASRITGPVRVLADMVERARSGSYSGKVQVDSRDEIGDLARTFNSLLADLREKEQLIGFLREGMTMMKKGGRGADRERARPPSARAPPRWGRRDHDPRRGRRAARAGPRKGEPVRRPLRGAEHARQGRDGRRVPRPRPDPRRHRGPEGAARRDAEGRPHPPRALQAGDQAGPPHHPPERPAHPRFRRGRGHALHLDGVPGGRDPQGPDQEQGRAAGAASACASPSRCARGWRPRTCRAWCTATSSPRTC